MLRHAKLGALADALAAAAFDDVDLGGVFVRRLPSLDGAAVRRVPVVLANGTGMRCGARRVGALCSGQRLVRLILPVLLRGRCVRLIVLSQSSVHASADRIVEGSHVLYLGVLKADKCGLLPDLIVLMQSAVGSSSSNAASVLSLSGNGVVGHELSTIQRAVIEWLLEQHLLVEHAEHLGVNVVADIFVVHIHLHFVHLVVLLWLFRAVLHLPHQGQFISQPYLVLLNLVLEISHVLVVLCLLIVGGFFALGAGLQIPHRRDLLLLGLLGELVLSIFAAIPL